MVRVVVVDDHSALRRGTCAILQESPDIDVVGEAADGQEAIAAVETLQPDVLVLDLGLPVKDGVEVTRELKSKSPRPGIVIFSAADQDDQILRALRAGADGYITKLAPDELIVQAVGLVAAGRMALLQTVVSDALLRAPQERERLTERERAVLREAAKDLGNKEIALRLEISDRTVQQHLGNIFAKLAVKSRTGAVLKALQLGDLSLLEIADP